MQAVTELSDLVEWCTMQHLVIIESLRSKDPKSSLQNRTTANMSNLANGLSYQLETRLDYSLYVVYHNI